MLQILVGGAVGAVFGAAVSMGTDVIKGQPIDLGRATESAMIGAVAGAITVATLGAGTAVVSSLVPAGVTATTTEAIVAGATVGYLAGDLGERAALYTRNVLQHRPLMEDLDTPFTFSGLAGGFTGGLSVLLVPEITAGAGTLLNGKLLPVGLVDDALLPTAGDGLRRATLFGANWKQVSLRDAVKGLGSPDEVVASVSETGQKINFVNTRTGQMVVYDPQGNYFRVLGSNKTALGVDGKPVSNNVALVGEDGAPLLNANGKPRYRQLTGEEFKAYQWQETHFGSTDSVADAVALAKDHGLPATVTSDTTAATATTAPISPGFLAPLGTVAGVKADGGD